MFSPWGIRLPYGTPARLELCIFIPDSLLLNNANHQEKQNNTVSPIGKTLIVGILPHTKLQYCCMSGRG